jgi:hypothetical protein
MKKMILKIIMLLCLAGALASMPHIEGAATAGELAQAPKVVLGSSDKSDSDPAGFGWAMLAASTFCIILYYPQTKSRYRGDMKRHKHEELTKSEIDGLEKNDVYLREVKNASSDQIAPPYQYSNELKLTIGRRDLDNEKALREIKLKKKL